MQQETDNKISQPEIHKIQKSDISEKHGWTVLMEVARRGQVKMLKQLISADVQLDAQDQQGRTAIMHAAQTGAQNTLALLVEAGAKTGIQDRNGNTAVAYAANAGNVPGLKLLLSVAPHSSIFDASVLELLEKAVIAGRSETALVLLHYLPPPLDKSRQGFLLSYAVRKCSVSVLNEFFTKGYSQNFIDEAGRSLIWHAIAVGNTTNVSYLIRLGVSTDKADKQGMSPLMVA